MYNTTGLSKAEILDLGARIHVAIAEGEKTPWPPILGLYKALVVTLTYLRRNRAQAEIAETYGVSQSTISRAITGLTPIIGAVLVVAVSPQSVLGQAQDHRARCPGRLHTRRNTCLDFRSDRWPPPRLVQLAGFPSPDNPQPRELDRR